MAAIEFDWTNLCFFLTEKTEVIRIKRENGGEKMLEDLLSIGETAQLMGISVQSLRSYCNIGILEPEYVDPQTGYRYFSFHQFHYIDKIKYMRKLGMSLADIKEVFAANDTSKLLSILQAQRDRLAHEREMLSSSIEDLDWYLEYFSFVKSRPQGDYPYIRYIPKRYALGTVCGKEESVPDIETRLTHIRHQPEAQVFHYYRQYGYTCSVEALKQGKFDPEYHYMFFKFLPENIPDALQENVLTFPAGEYLCFSDFPRSTYFDGKATARKALNVPDSTLAIANEFESELSSYGYDAIFEFQILLRPETE